MRRKFLAAVLDGVALPGFDSAPHRFQRLSGDDMSRMRGDVERVGVYFKTVIAREHGDKKKFTTAGSQSKSTK